MTDKENPITISHLLSETAQLNQQLLQLQINNLENELIIYIEPLQALLAEKASKHPAANTLSLHSLHEKLIRLHHLRFEMNQTEILCQAA